ncbi:MAG: bifunctional DedA family/phosphatase PAP2 family protein [Desulfobulbaceae bacterium]
MLHLDTIVSFITRYTELAYGAIFLISLAESLALVGLLVPGTVIMFGVGAVVATGVLGLAPVLLVAMAGAIAGDGVSYWLGRHYRERLGSVRPFSLFPRMLTRGREFFCRHGGKSILFGRFVGPVRPVIPVVAGMLGMDPLRFTLVNILSAVGWALVYILPGFLFGTSIGVAGTVSTRLAVVVAILIAAVWSFAWFCRKTASFFLEKAPGWLAGLEHWSSVDRGSDRGVLIPVKRFVAFLSSRRQGDAILLLFLILVLFFAGWGTLGVLQDVLARDPLVVADQAVFHFFQSLRTSWADTLFVAVTEFGDASVTFLVACSVTGVLLFRRCYRAAGFWTGTALGGFLGVQLLKLILHLPRPVALYHGASSYSFPSGHTTMTVILYGFLAILLARELAGRWRLGVLSAVLLVAFVIGFSRLYLGAHWLSDVLGGYLIGTGWAAFMGIIYLKKAREEIPRRLLVIVVTLVLVVAGGLHVAWYHDKDMAFYAPRRTIQVLSLASWRTGGWRSLPSMRVDMEGEYEQPLTLQLAADPGELNRFLVHNAGWQPPESLNLRSVLGMLSPQATVDQLPVLPRFHEGRVEHLRLVRKEKGGGGRLVLRLWPSDTVINESSTPLFVGTVEEQRRVGVTGLFAMARDTGEYEKALAVLEQQLHSRFSVERVRRPLDEILAHPGHNRPKWSGDVLLLRDGKS